MEEISWEDIIAQDYGNESLENLSPTFFWAEYLKNELTLSTVNDWLEIGHPNGILLIGPPGNGRHTIAEAVAVTMHRQRAFPFQLIRLDGMDLGGESSAELLSGMETLFRFASPENRILILLENISDCQYSTELQKFLTRALRMSMNDKNPSWMLLMIADEQEELEPRLLSCMQICRCLPPDGEERKKWLREISVSLLKKSATDLDEFGFMEATQGFSWGDLANLERSLRILLKRKVLEKVPINNRDTDEVLLQKRKKVQQSGEVSFSMEEVKQICRRMSIREQKTEQVLQIAAQLPPQEQVISPASETQPQGYTVAAASVTDQPILPDREIVPDSGENEKTSDELAAEISANPQHRDIGKMMAFVGTLDVTVQSY